MLDDLGNLGDFLGGIGVVVTLAYLALQIRQNTRAMRTASRQQVAESFRSLNRLALDPRLARVHAMGLRSFPDLAFDERTSFNGIMNEHTLFFQGAFALHESGQLEEQTYKAYREWVAMQLATPGGRAWWEMARPFYAPGSVEALDARVEQGGLADVLELDGYRLGGPVAD